MKSMKVLSGKLDLFGTENAFKVGPYILEAEKQLGQKVIRCNLGEPDFELAEHIKGAVKVAIDEGMTHYCDPQGILSLRQAIARTMGERRGLDINPDQVVVFPGAKPPIAFCQFMYCDLGNEVIYPSPGFPIYESVVRFVGSKPVPVPLREEAGFSLRLTSEYFRRWTSLIYLNFPSNPTGGVASKKQLEEIAELILRLTREWGIELRVYSDEVYEDIIFDGKEHYSIASIPEMRDMTVIVSGVSKSYAWTGGRVGWAVFPTVEEAQLAKMLNINFYSCVAVNNQCGAQVALEDERSKASVKAMVDEFQRRRDFIVPALNGIPGIRCQNPGGAFYVFPNIKGICEQLGIFEFFRSLPEDKRRKTSPSTLLQMFLLYCYGIATMDRKSFGTIGSENEHYLRLSFATGMEDLKWAMERIAEAAKDEQGFRRFIESGGRLH